MAFVREEHCSVCNRETQHCNGKCSECAKKKRNAEVAAWEIQSVEEKLTDLRKRVEHLEQRGRGVFDFT